MIVVWYNEIMLHFSEKMPFLVETCQIYGGCAILLQSVIMHVEWVTISHPLPKQLPLVWEEPFVFEIYNPVRTRLLIVVGGGSGNGLLYTLTLRGIASWNCGKLR